MLIDAKKMRKTTENLAWSCIALTRIPMELGYLSVVDSQKIIWLRLLVGIPLPIIAGLLAGVLASSKLKM